MPAKPGGCFFLIVIIFCFFLSRGYALNDQIADKTSLLENQEFSLANNKLLLFIINFDSFMCPSCLDSFIEFYHELPSSLGKGMIWGILVFDKPTERAEQDLPIKIIEKKLRGFISANNIKFPILIDRLPIFKGLSKVGTAVVLFDRERNLVKKYVFPLSQIQIKEIIGEEVIH